MNPKVIQADVTVVGDGIIGQSIAFEARRVGLRVVLVSKSLPGAATPAAGGMLCPSGEAFESEQRLINLATESCRIYPDFIKRIEEISGQSTGYDRSGTLMVALTRDHVGQLEQLGKAQRERGLQTRWLEPNVLKEIEPHISPRQCGALLAGDDHQVNPIMLHAALLAANRKSGVQILEHSGTIQLETQGGTAHGVALLEHPGHPRIESPWVVSASGAWSSEIEELQELPLRPVRGQYVRLRGAPLLKHVVRTPDLYMIPRADGVLYLGGSMEEAGFDPKPLAGHTMDLLWHGFRAVPGIYELEMLETAAGFRPALRDNLPAIGHCNIPGLLTAIGHYRHGIMLAPITAAAILELLQANRVPELVQQLSARRFEDEK